MLNKLEKHKFKIAIAVVIVICFAIVRFFENNLFYDPFSVFFNSDSKDAPLPEYDSFRLFLGIFIRYVLNAALSVALIYVLFRDIEILKFSVILYVFFLVILFGLFFLILIYFPQNKWLLFYIRRFLIQPIFVLLFIPAFYYQQQKTKN